MFNLNGMSFATGNLRSYMKNMELYHKFEENTRNPKLKNEDTEKTQRERDLERFREDAIRAQEGNKISAIDTKLMSGMELTTEELNYLKEKSPELYKKAIEVKKERERYKEELKNCRTKEDVQRLNTRKSQEFVAELHGVSRNPNIPSGEKKELIAQISRRYMAVLSEQVKFLASKEYAQLPEEDDEEVKKKKRRGKNVDQTISFEDASNQVKAELLRLDEISAGISTYSSDGDVKEIKIQTDAKLGTSLNQKV